MMKPATEILLSAAFVLTPEENWTQATVARNAQGHRVGISDTSACKFCLAGAMMAAQDALSYSSEVYDAALASLSKAIGTELVGTWNDEYNRRHRTALNALYRAAELSEAA